MGGQTETPDMSGIEPAFDVRALAAWTGLVVSPACLAGVAGSLEILRGHMEIVRAAAAELPPDPAELLAP